MGTDERSWLLVVGTVLLVAGLFADLIVLSTVPPSELSWLVREGAFDDCTRVTNVTSAHDCWTMTLIGLDSAHLYLALACLIIFGAVVQRTEVDRRANLQAGQSGACAHINCTAKFVLFGSGAGVVLAVAAFFFTLLSGAPMFVSSTRSDACTGSAANADPIDCWGAIKSHAIAVISVALVLVALVAAAENIPRLNSRIEGLLAAVVGCSCLPMLVGGARLLAERALLTGEGRLIAATVVTMSAPMGILLLLGVPELRKTRGQPALEEKAPLKPSSTDTPEKDRKPVASAAPSRASQRVAWWRSAVGAVLWAVLFVLALLHAIVVSDDPHPRVSFISRSVLEACATATPATTIDCWETVDVWTNAGLLMLATGLAATMRVVALESLDSEHKKRDGVSLTPAEDFARLLLRVVMSLTPSLTALIFFTLRNMQTNGLDDAFVNTAAALGVGGAGALGFMLCMSCISFCDLGFLDPNYLDGAFVTAVVLNVCVVICSLVLYIFSFRDGLSEYSGDVERACAGVGSQATSALPPAPINCWRVARPLAIALVVYALVMLACIYVRACARASRHRAIEVARADAGMLASAGLAASIAIVAGMWDEIDQFDQTGTNAARITAGAVIALSFLLAMLCCTKTDVEGDREATKRGGHRVVRASINGGHDRGR